MKKVLTLLAIVATSCSSVLAGPIKSNVIPADAKIVAHVNMEAFRASKLGELSKVIEDAEKSDLGASELDDFKKITDKLGFDPTAELVSLTAYVNGLDIEEDGGVLIAESANPVMDEAKIVEIIKSEAKDTPVTEEKNGDSTFYTIGQGNTTGKLSFISNKAVMLSNTSESLTKALKLYSDKTGNFKAISKAPAGSFFTLQVTGIKEAIEKSMDPQNPNPQAMMLQNVKSVTCFAGESQGSAFLNISIGTDSADAATQLSQLAMGMLPMLTMQPAQSNPELAGILQKITITPEGSNVVVSLKHPAKDLIETVKKGIEDTKKSMTSNSSGISAAPTAPAIQ